jgi:hypothetical protein
MGYWVVILIGLLGGVAVGIQSPARACEKIIVNLKESQ